MCNLNLKSNSDVQGVFDTNIFSDLLNVFQEKCPLLHSVLQTLSITDKRKQVYKYPSTI